MAYGMKPFRVKKSTRFFRKRGRRFAERTFRNQRERRGRFSERALREAARMGDRDAQRLVRLLDRSRRRRAEFEDEFDNSGNFRSYQVTGSRM